MPKIEFRKEALEWLHSPEQLDGIMEVVTPKNWLLLFVSLFLVTVLLIWSFMAEIPITVNGYGILLYRGELTYGLSQTRGILQELKVVDGQPVKKGDVVAKIQIPDLEQQIQELKTEVEGAKINKSPQLFQFQAYLGLLEQRYAYASSVYAPADGVVMEILERPSTEVYTGTPVLILSPPGNSKRDLMAKIFISAEHADAVRSGMEVLVAPTFLSVEREGYLKGVVESVAYLPTDTSTILSVLRISNLTQFIQKKVKMPFYVSVKLVLDDSQVSGYAWTSVGPRRALQPGLLTSCKIVTSYRRPIEYLFPGLHAYFKEI